MRKLLGVVLAAGAVGLGSATAQAGPLALTLANLEVVIAGNPLNFPATGATGSASSNLTVTLGAGSAFAGKAAVSLAGPTVTFVSATVKHNAAGVFKGTAPGNVHGGALFTGGANVYGLGGAKLLALPLKLGVPGTGFATKTNKGKIALAVTTIGASWTAGVKQIKGVIAPTTMGGTIKNGTVTVAGNNALTPGGNGTLTLVSPGKVLTSLSASPAIASPGFLTLTFVPEPGTLLLLGSGIAGLVVIGRRQA